MKKLLMLITVAFISGNMIAQADNGLAVTISVTTVPQIVIKSFSTQFPAGRLKKWELQQGVYIAAFRQDGKKLFAYYNADGSWRGTEAPIKWTKNLPDSVKAGWKVSGYYDWYVADIKRIETPEQPLYVLHVNNGTLLDADHHDAFLEEYLLYFSGKGELVRKVRMP
jgi:hypothetical protein